MIEMNGFPFRLGTTSYIIPADILSNVRYLAGKVRDVELVLFDVDDGMNNLPSPDEIEQLLMIASQTDLTYTVHLPLDLRLAEGDSIDKARRVIDCTRRLDPWAYVLHLDGKSVRHGASSGELRHWLEQAVRSLKIVGEYAGGVEKLAVENLEGYPLDFYEPVLKQIAVSRTVDVGHLWLDGYDAIGYLNDALPRTRVIHIHGIDGRDHRSLTNVPREKLQAVLSQLIRTGHRGVLTIEVFSEEDFLTSSAAIQEALKGVQHDS
ncbi:MAG TPA: cobamide remodeling phosphodiesterase CbiR [Smithellaceae bacterium]|nr:sugar phosphate isomerase/epimerase [Smithella sp.]HNZ10087.1 cobamide remodeling phosphodiesterase CbiR [Smithellaceae bacterium]HOG81817.1 cobamide remodeling phosphodiesterase CbiR [Smithellaceae bacterium]